MMLTAFQQTELFGLLLHALFWGHVTHWPLCLERGLRLGLDPGGWNALTGGSPTSSESGTKLVKEKGNSFGLLLNCGNFIFAQRFILNLSQYTLNCSPITEWWGHVITLNNLHDDRPAAEERHVTHTLEATSAKKSRVEKFNEANRYIQRESFDLPQAWDEKEST